MMFETYLKQVDSILNEIRSIAKEVEVTENVIQIRLDAARNKILRLEVYLNLATMSLAAGERCAFFSLASASNQAGSGCSRTCVNRLLFRLFSQVPSSLACSA
mmetsp:Transcript_38987/g.154338  ORF Transcript_38987/g.154338 Transcript_38987/m.154338 type:complete len:103 (+) Transcript_38987:977-1285(+)